MYQSYNKSPVLNLVSDNNPYLWLTGLEEVFVNHLLL